MRINREGDSGVTEIRRYCVVPMIAVLAIVLLGACASLKNPPGTVTARFTDNPDRVWEGIHLTLETLEFVVESANRDEGVIRAAKVAEDRTPWVALEISQVMHTDDQVNVYVVGVAEDPANPPDEETLEKAAQDFVSVLKRKLGE